MKIKELRVEKFRSLRELTLPLRQINLLIGANAAGKSNVLDALKFLSEAVKEGDFSFAVFSRGNVIQLAWKGEEAHEFELECVFEDGERELRWLVRIVRQQMDFFVEESLHDVTPGHPPQELLRSRAGKGTWYSQDGRIIRLSVAPTSCALAAAAADETFPGRDVGRFVKGWTFCDPSPSYLRMPTSPRDEGLELDAWGRNLAGRLLEINQRDALLFNRITQAVRNILGVPESIEAIASEDGEVFLLQREAGFQFRIHQKSVSTGTLRMLALITALLGHKEASLIGIEEPENYVHPGALAAFAEYLRDASNQIQVLVTTHSPILLNYLNTPEAVCVVRRSDEGTKILREDNPDAVRKALEESGFGLGDFLETKGFGA